MDGTKYLPLLGRVLMGLPFVMSGLGKLTIYGPVTAKISEAGLPLAPLGWLIAVVLEVGGGLLLVIGFRAVGAAFALAVFTLAAAVVFHHHFADQNQMIHFLKNLMMAGGLLQIVHFGAGPYSVDARRRIKLADAPH
jgi:putative oxidoreductase